MQAGQYPAQTHSTITKFCTKVYTLFDFFKMCKRFLFCANSVKNTAPAVWVLCFMKDSNYLLEI